MEQLQQWRQRDLLMLAEANRQARLDIAVRAEIANLLDLVGDVEIAMTVRTNEWQMPDRPWTATSRRG